MRVDSDRQAPRQDVGALFWLAVGGIALLGMGLVWAATRWGAFLGDDSYYYVQPAQAALAGDGFSPSPFFAPALPFLMLVLGWLGADLVIAFRLLNAALFGVNLVLTALILREWNLRPGFVLWGVGLVAVVDVFIETHGWAMSEPLYLTFTLGAILCLLKYLRADRWTWLLGCTLLAAAANLTRYAALPLVPAVGLALLVLDSRRDLGRRLVRAVVFGLAAVLPLAGYLLRNRLMSGRLTRYEAFRIPPLSGEKLRWFLYSIESWFIPGRFIKGREILAGVVLVVVILGAMFLFRFLHRDVPSGKKSPVFSPGTLVWGLFIVFNLVMLFLVRGLSGLAPYNVRYLVPVLLGLLLILAAILDRAWGRARTFVKAGMIVSCGLFFVYYAYRGADFVLQTRRTGLGYSNIGWQESETIPYLEAHPDLDYAATGEIGIYFWTGEKPPPIVAYGSLAGLRAHLCETGQLLVLMDQMPPELYGYPRDQLVEGLNLVHDFNDSMVYACSQ
jgi:hypothetical protein